MPSESLREDPPSASSPPQSRALEGMVEAEPESALPSAPELPLPIQDSLRGFLEGRSPRGQAEGIKKEGLFYYMGAFMACAST